MLSASNIILHLSYLIDRPDIGSYHAWLGIAVEYTTIIYTVNGIQAYKQSSLVVTSDSNQ